MFSLFARPTTTGVAFGSGEVRAARAVIKGSSLSLLEHAEQAIPDGSDGAIASTLFSGGAPDAEKLTLAVRSLQTAGHLSLKRSIVLLPAACVYTQFFVFPAVAKKNLAAFVNDAVARTIPETFALLRIVRRILQESADSIEVGIAAIRQDVLQSYRSACSSSEGQVIALTTAPCAIVSTHREPKPNSFLLASASAQRTIVTLFHHLWPIDEVILPAAVQIDILVQTAESMAAEYREQGLVIEKMFLAGSWEGASPTPALTPALTPTPTLSLESIFLFPDFKDRSWLDCACASVVNVAELAVNFET